MDATGLAYEALAPDVDETTDLAPKEAVLMLAEKKARAVLARRPSALVIGADQLVSLDGKALGKPQDAGAAHAQIAALSGRAHEIVTGLCVISAGFCAVELDIARLTMWPLSADEIAGYVASGEWQGCAGGYRIEARGQLLFAEIDGDRAAIQGLPMQRVVRLLREAQQQEQAAKA
jgi:septum formation protein